MFFGSMTTIPKLAAYVAGGLIGVTVNRAVLPLLPDAITSSNLWSSLAAFGIAAAEWWVGNLINKEFGAAVGFGGLMNAGSTALNSFLPQVGSKISLKGVGDFVPANFAVPQNPILDATTNGMGAGGALMHTAYPVPYGRAA